MQVHTRGGSASFRPKPFVGAYTERRGNLTRGRTMTSRTGIMGSCEIAASLLPGYTSKAQVQPKAVPSLLCTPTGVRSSQ